ncbi:DNA repair protein RecN [bacterium]|nr:DNA repair protein RecN [bacterium]
MIKNIYVKDYIIADEISLDMTKGLNVITGETGAGKSILINAVDIVLGGKVSKDVIKKGKEKTVLEVTFLKGRNDFGELFEENGIDDIGDEIVITKEITPTSSKSKINGTMVSLDIIKQMRENLVDIHSQHQTYSLLQQKNHITLLDAYAKSEIEEKLTEYKDLYAKYNHLKKVLEVIKASYEKTEAETDFIKFQIDEIEAAEITDENEDTNIKEELSVLENAEKLKETTGKVYWSLSNDDESILNGLSKIKFELSKAVGMDNSLKETEQDFITAEELLKDISYRLRDYSQSLNNDTERLNSLQERLFLLDKLKHKYGGSLSSVLETYEKLTTQYKDIENSSENIELTEKEISETLEKMKEVSATISQIRRKYAKELSDLIVKKLQKLELEKSRFEISIEECELNENGCDRVEFLISTNVSEDLKPLAKTASGGEISRVMLAIKTVFADTDGIETIIFDEIDTGISGKTSQSVAEEIDNLSEHMQVIIITHQPIIASKADEYIYVSKTQSDTTTINVSILNEEEKVKALAELASGSRDETAVDFAKTLLKG